MYGQKDVSKCRTIAYQLDIFQLIAFADKNICIPRAISTQNQWCCLMRLKKSDGINKSSHQLAIFRAALVRPGARTTQNSVLGPDQVCKMSSNPVSPKLTAAAIG